MKAKQARKRPGFTLVELLVVIGIITVLVGLTAVGVFAWVQSRTYNNARTRIQGINTLLQQHWKKVIADAAKEIPSPGVTALANGDAKRARVIHAKARLMEAFPMSFAEIQNPNVLYGGQNPLIAPDKRKYILGSYKKKLGTISNAKNAGTESAACLLLALSVNRGAANIDLELYQADSDGDGVMEFVDDWGSPLYFYRFPTNNDKLLVANPAGSNSKQSKFQDPLDPDGTLVSPNWPAANRKAFEQTFHPITGSSGVFYTVPTIVSPGPDQQLGLAGATMAINDPLQAADNIYSFQLTMGGGKGS